MDKIISLDIYSDIIVANYFTKSLGKPSVVKLPMTFNELKDIFNIKSELVYDLPLGTVALNINGNYHTYFVAVPNHNSVYYLRVTGVGLIPALDLAKEVNVDLASIFDSQNGTLTLKLHIPYNLYQVNLMYDSIQRKASAITVYSYMMYEYRGPNTQLLVSYQPNIYNDGKVCFGSVSMELGDNSLGAMVTRNIRMIHEAQRATDLNSDSLRDLIYAHDKIFSSENDWLSKMPSKRKITLGDLYAKH